MEAMLLVSKISLVLAIEYLVVTKYI